MNPRIEEAATRLSDKTASRLSDTGDQIASEAAEWADRMSEWLAETGPVVTETVRSRAGETVESAKDWAETLPERLAKALPVVTVYAKPKKRTLVGVFALGAAAAYFLDPQLGSERRDRVKQKVSGLFGGSDQEA